MTTPADDGIAAAKRDAQATRDAAAQLWWSGRSRIACAEHVPRPGSDAWWMDRWELADPNWIEGYTRGHKQPPVCEACVALELLARGPGAAS
jgi:hypothetical protein